MCKDAIVFFNKPQGVELEAGKTYRFCMCGRSKDGLFCDDSHQGTSCEPKEFTVEKTKDYQLCRCKSSDNLPFCSGNHSYYADSDVGGPVTS
jgi:CDGSH-type Zn-finger protein